MKNKETPQRATAHDRTKVEWVLGGLYNLLGENVTVKGANYRDIAKDILHMPEGALLRLVVDFERAGVLIRSYKRQPGDPNFGKTSRWTLPLPEGEAIARIRAYWADIEPFEPWKKPVASPEYKAAVREEQEHNAPILKRMQTETIAETQAIAIRHSNGEAVEAIAGPDAPKPFDTLRSERKDEAGALIQAARQYSDRRNVIKRAFEEMEKQGITVDWTHVNDVVSVETDDRLDAIVSVLPYITALEKRVDRLAADNTEVRDRLKGVDNLSVENKKLREQNQRLLAERVRSFMANT